MRLLPCLSRPFVIASLWCVTLALLLGGPVAQAQGLAGPWDLVESADAQGPTAGKMTLSSNGQVLFDGAPSTWQPNDNTLQFTVIGKMQLPVSEVEMRLSGTTLLGSILVHSYRRNGNTLELTSRKRFPISARRPEGFVEPQVAATPQRDNTSTAEQPSAGIAATGTSLAVGANHSPATVTGKPSGATPSYAAGDSSGAATGGSAPAAEQRKMGPDQLEGVALCWENRRVAGHFTCDGPVQLLSVSEPLEKALELVGCPSPRTTDGSRTVNNRESMVYLCGYGLVKSDRDMVRRHGITVQRNVYRCSGSTSSKYRCNENYQTMN